MAGENAEHGSAAAALLHRPVLVAYIVISILVSFVYAQYNFALPLQIDALFTDDRARLFGYIMTFNAVVVLFLTTEVTRLTSRSLPVTNLMIASFLYAVGFGLNGYIKVMPMFLFAAFFWTLGEILMVPNANVFIAKYMPITHHGRFNSIVSLVQGIGYVLCPWVTDRMI